MKKLISAAVVVLSVAFAFLLLSFETVPKEATSQEVKDLGTATLIFNWEGAINQNTVNGNGALFIDRNTGNFTASGAFDTPFETFNPAAAKWSFFSISCQNGGKDDDTDGGVIIDIANEEYISTRKVQIYNAANEIVGDFQISGHFKRLSKDAFKTNATVSGFYHAPTELEFPQGYTLCVKPDGENRLKGKLSTELVAKNGEKFRAEHSQEYFFVDGTKKELKAQTMDLKYDYQNAQYNAEKGFLRFSGNSTIRLPYDYELTSR